MNLDIKNLSRWIDKHETVEDIIDLATCRRMEATLDQPALLKDGDPLPPLWHWCFFHQAARASLLGRDGHPEKGNFLPPVPLPRRMWAGGRLQFENPLPIGASAQKISTIKSVSAKQGRAGPLCFVTVEHRITHRGHVCLIEEHDIVYRDDPKRDDPKPLPPPADLDPGYNRTIDPDPVMLFRYSALTFNGHRIHYDRDYCRDVEGYPGLVIHGPLTATLMAGLAVENNPGGHLCAFEFRATRPLFDTAAFSIAGWRNKQHQELQAVNHDGGLAMKAKAGFA